MSTNTDRARATVERFYAAFRALDGATMQACYAVDARFDDPAFALQGRERIGAMWRMLCEGVEGRGRAHWQLDAEGIAVDADARHGCAHWEARYLFGATGRLVHNRIDAHFEFDPAGLIAVHRDHFPFWRWSRQALGAPGLLLGWTPWLRTQVRRQAAARLDAWIARQGRAAPTA